MSDSTGGANPRGSVMLIRHASAGHRAGDHASNQARPLDNTGLAQAESLALALSDLEISVIVSSPLTRCVQTVQPLADRRRAIVEIDGRLAEQTPIEESWGLIEVICDQLDSPGVDQVAIMCSHGDVIPDIVRRATMRGTRVIGRSGNQKGSIWHLEGWNGTTFSSARYIASSELEGKKFSPYDLPNG